MKANKTWITVVLFGAIQSVTTAQTTNQDLSVSASQTQIQPVYPAVEYRLEPKTPGTNSVATEIITRYGPESSQSWTAIAARQGNPTTFHDVRTHEAQLYLCWFGHAPWR